MPFPKHYNDESVVRCCVKDRFSKSVDFVPYVVVGIRGRKVKLMYQQRK